MSRGAMPAAALLWTERLLEDLVRRGCARLGPGGAEPPIRELHIELTRRCDLSCVMCHQWRLHRADPAGARRELKACDVRRIVTGARALDGVDTVVLTGGEPFLRPDLAEVAAVLARRFPDAGLGVLSHLAGTALVRRRLGELRAAGVRRLWLGSSLDGLERMHDLVRGRQGAFRGLLRSVEMLRREFPEVPFSFNFTITPRNYRQLWPAYRFVTEMGVWFGAQLAVNHEGFAAGASVRWRPSQLAEVGRQAELILADLCARDDLLSRLLQGREGESPGLWTRVLFWHYLKEYIRRPRRIFADCLAGRRYAMLDPEGNLFFCPVNKHRTVGSVREGTFDAVWESPRARAERSFVASGRCHCWLHCTANPVLDRVVALGSRA